MSILWNNALFVYVTHFESENRHAKFIERVTVLPDVIRFSLHHQPTHTPNAIYFCHVSF